jgi:hypothetical protein
MDKVPHVQPSHGTIGGMLNKPAEMADLPPH